MQKECQTLWNWGSQQPLNIKTSWNSEYCESEVFCPRIEHNAMIKPALNPQFSKTWAIMLSITANDDDTL